MTTPPESGEQPVQVQDATVYVLNARGYNRWSATVQPGHDEAHRRISDDECEAIAKRIGAAISAPQSGEQPVAPDGWMHESDPQRVISGAQKRNALRDGGASASSVAPYSIPLFRGRGQAAQAADVVAPSDEAIMAAAEGLFVAGVNQLVQGEYCYRGTGLPYNVSKRHLLGFARRAIALASKVVGRG